MRAINSGNTAGYNQVCASMTQMHTKLSPRPREQATSFETEEPVALALAIVHVLLCRANMQRGSAEMDMRYTEQGAAHTEVCP